jgi:hypothetical protein
MKATFDLSPSTCGYESQISVDELIPDKIIPLFFPNEGNKPANAQPKSMMLSASVARSSQKTATLEAVAYVSIEIAAAALVTISLLG